jgi:hypothetical protein
MIARRFTTEQAQALVRGQRVAHFIGGGTSYRPVTFLGLIDGTTRAMIQFGDSPTRPVEVKNLGPLEGRIEEAPNAAS